MTDTKEYVSSFDILNTALAGLVPEQEETPYHFSELEACKELGVAKLDSTILNQY